MKALKPSQLAIALTSMYSRKRPVFVWGGPGIGKSDIIRQVADQLGVGIIDIRALLLDPVDFRGLPSIHGRKTVWNPPAFLPTMGDGILFLDELNDAPPMIQAACYQLILDRRIGEYRLPDGWQVIAAGNRESDGGVTSRMPTPLRNRFMHVELEADHMEWSKWAVQNNVEPVVIAFVRFRPELLYQFSRDSKAFATPRSWAFVSDIIAGQCPDKDTEHSLIEGTVGDGPAVEFSAFLRTYRELPNIDALLMNPDREPVPNNPATLYAIAAALSRRATVQNIGRVCKYLERCPVEFNVMSMKDALLRDKALQSTADVTKWAVRHQDVIL